MPSLAQHPLQLILNDVIVSWRAKVVWSGAKLVQCGLLLVLVAAIGVNLTDSIFGNLNINTLGNSATNLDFASLFVSFAVNWTATLMVTVKFWKHRQAVKFLYKNPSQSQSLTILLALVESGIIFCLVQLFYAIWTVIDFFSVENSPVDMTYRVIDRMFNAVVALYPMVVIILVNVKKLPLEETFYYDVRIHVHDSSDDIELDSVH
ncbi:hypothetical protein BT96DRAFT_107979 [Gymnopus androsaceus JB14]|uniref:Uncharacterized protein n=1 Tax=Gymnopus androsaceus JB14 TaxID=1447944 RepID=A0A6A4IFP6_9AGAR|nr:hypothetical protein BT96DRAFT_107979 [Gymnopus androsaceus JB14]